MYNRRRLHSACFVYKIIRYKNPKYLFQRLKFRTDIHNLNLRHRSSLTVPAHRKEIFKRSFSYCAASLMNQLKIQRFQERKRQIEESTTRSTEQSLGILRDSEQIGIATAEELKRQREKLEKTDKQLDDINNTLRFSQKHNNGIKSVFSSLKNYMAGKNDKSPTTSSSTPSTVRDAENET